MFDEFVERYAGMLSGRDVSELFDRLTDLVGTIAEAARVCEVERRTPYYWRPDESPEVRLQTKKKVLKALIERDFEFTLKFMIERSADASRNMLRMYLGTIYEKAMDPAISNQNFQNLLNELRQLRIGYSELIDSALAEELSDMLLNLKTEAENRDVDFPPLPLSTMTAEDVVRYLPRLTRLVPRYADNVTLDSLSRELNFPKELVKLASDLAPPILPPRGILTSRGADQVILLGFEFSNPLTIPVSSLKIDGVGRLAGSSEIGGITLDYGVNPERLPMRQIPSNSESAPRSVPLIS